MRSMGEKEKVCMMMCMNARMVIRINKTTFMPCLVFFDYMTAEGDYVDDDDEMLNYSRICIPLLCTLPTTSSQQ